MESEETISQKEKIFDLKQKPFGLSYQDYVIAWWKWLISIPKDRNPDPDNTGERSAEGQDPKFPVFFLSSGNPDNKIQRKCEIPSNKGIFIPIMPVEVSDKEVDEIKNMKSKLSIIDYMKRKAKKDQDGVTELYLKIDEDEYQLETLRKFRINQTYVFDVIFPSNNIYDREPGPSKAVADGHYIIINPLSKGEHRIKWISEATCKNNEKDINDPQCIDDNFKQDIEYIITVR